MSISRRKIYLILYGIILSWETWLHYFISTPLNYMDITNLLCIIFIGMYLAEKHFVMTKVKQWISFCVIVLTSSFMATSLFGQSFLDGVLVCRHMYLQFAVCIPLTGLFKTNSVNRNEFISLTIKTIRFACILYVVHYLLYEIFNVSLLKISAASFGRYGSSRFYFVLIMPMFLLMNAISNIYKSKYKLMDYIDVALVLFLMMQVGKMRMTTLSCLIAIFLGLIQMRHMGRRKIYFFSAVLMGAFFILKFTSMGQDLLNVFFGGQSAGSEGIRSIGRLQHIRSFLKSPILGMGYPHENCAASMAEFGTSFKYLIEGTYQKIYIGDNGIFDFLYIFGLSGIIWLIYTFGGFLRKAYKIMIYNKNSTYFMYVMALIIQMYTEFNWFFFGMLFIGVFTSIIATENNDESCE